MRWGLVAALAFCANSRNAWPAKAFSISFRPPQPPVTLRVASNFNPEIALGAEVVRLVREAFAAGGTDGLALAVATASIASPVGEESQRLLLDSLTAADWVDAVVVATGGSDPDIGSRSSCLTTIISELGRPPGEARGFGGGVDQSLLVEEKFSVLTVLPRSEDGADVSRSYNGAVARAKKSLELLRLMSEPPCDCPPSVVAVSAAATAFFEAAAAVETDEEVATLEAAGYGVLSGDWRLARKGVTRGGGGRRVRVKRGGRAPPRPKSNVGCGGVVEGHEAGNGGGALLLGGVLPVLFEDKHIVCVAKPAGMLVNRVPGTPSGEDVACEIVDHALRARAEPKEGPTEKLSIGAGMGVPSHAPGVVHRLDRGTSGVLVLAKTDRAHAALVVSFFRRLPSKTYLCIVIGSPGTTGVSIGKVLQGSTSGVISLPLDGHPAESCWRLCEELFVPSGAPVSLLEAPNAALLEVKTLTGRRHQVRRHVACGLGCPIALDPLYRSRSNARSEKASVAKRHGGAASPAETEDALTDLLILSTGEVTTGVEEDKKKKKKMMKTKKNKEKKKGHFFFLHAAALTIPHPSVRTASYQSGTTLGSIDLKAPLPAQWEKCLSVLRRSTPG